MGVESGSRHHCIPISCHDEKLISFPGLSDDVLYCTVEPFPLGRTGRRVWSVDVDMAHDALRTRKLCDEHNDAACDRVLVRTGIFWSQAGRCKIVGRRAIAVESNVISEERENPHVVPSPFLFVGFGREKRGVVRESAFQGIADGHSGSLAQLCVLNVDDQRQ